MTISRNPNYQEFLQNILTKIMMDFKTRVVNESGYKAYKDSSLWVTPIGPNALCHIVALSATNSTVPFIILES